jgi:hypothetical protein
LGKDREGSQGMEGEIMDIFKLLAGCIMLAIMVMIGCMAFQAILTVVMLVIAGVMTFFGWGWGKIFRRRG